MRTSNCNKSPTGAHRLTVAALTLATALILSYVESMLPSLPIPGVKLGLANVAVVFALYALGGVDAAAVSFVRVLMIGILFGNAASFFYSAAGALLSFILMAVLKKAGKFTVIGVSVAGGVAHNIGQVAAAVVLLGVDEILLYLPVLVGTGVIFGVVIGILGGVVIARVRP